MSDTLKLSIIIPIYNAARHIDCCISSIVKAHMTNYEIILVDDGSSDESLLVCSAWEKKIAEIKTIHTLNKGVSHARNVGLETAMGEWIVFIDADDYMFPQYFKKLAGAMNEENDYIFFSYLEKKNGIISEHSNITYKSNNDLGRLDMTQAMHLIFECKEVQGYVWNKAFKRKIILRYKIKFKEELRYNEDLLFCYEYLQHASRIKYIRAYLYCYVKAEGTTVTRKIDDSILESFQSFRYMLDVESKLPEVRYKYIHIAYIYMNWYLLKSALKRGYTDIELIKRLRMNIVSENFTYIKMYNSEIKILTILIRIVPQQLFNFLYRCFPNGFKRKKP